MKKFLITEEEKNHIKALYEQTSTVQQWEEKYKKGVTEEGNFYLVTGRGQSPDTSTARKIAFQDAGNKISAKINSKVSIPDGSEGENVLVKVGIPQVRTRMVAKVGSAA